MILHLCDHVNKSEEGSIWLWQSLFSLDTMLCILCLAWHRHILGLPPGRHSLSKKQLSGCGDALLSGVQAQLGILGDDHVGYSSKQFPDASISVVGARPFSAVS